MRDGRVCWESVMSRCGISSRWQPSTPRLQRLSKTAAMPASAGTATYAYSAANTKLLTRDSLTANQDVLRHPLVTGLATQQNATPEQIIFAFARSVGMLPLTGTSNSEHMQQDLASTALTLPADAVRAIEALVQ